MIRRLVISMLCLLAMCACKRSIVYSDFISLPADGWHQDSVLSYDICVEDSTADYDLLIVVRHTNEYPYQNLWLFVDEYAGTELLHRDTIEALLADDYGRWIAGGINKYDLPLQYATSYRFATASHNRITIQQGMRSPYLKGLSDVGVKVIQ